MNLFQSIRTKRPRLNKFDLSHERKMSMQMGHLVPFLVKDIVPGDKFRVNTEVMMRFAPMLAPVMHRVNVYTHYFFVPNRLVWSEWEDFITGGREGTSAPVAPYFELSEANRPLMQPGHLADYMGVPIPNTGDPAITNPLQISALPFRAYQQVYDEYYRDQNLTASIDLSLASGAVVGAELTKLLLMRQRAWEKDYFTSALPWAQRGPEVLMPIEGTGVVNYDDVTGILYKRLDDSDPAAGNLNNVGGAGSVVRDSANQTMKNVSNDTVTIDNAETTINELRRSIRLQEWLEKNARGGARYVEQILSHFGVKSSDARLQRPEYLGGGKQPVVISEVLSTFQQEAEGLPQGNMSGHGISVGRSNGFSKTFEEHGYVIGVMSVLPRTAYQQGLPRHLSKFDKFDYFWPEFANIGEQEIKNQEIYWDAQGAAGSNDVTFGYQSRYAEYKYDPSTVHGDFRNTLAYWHMGRIFDAPPVLNTGFVESDPTQRIFAVEEEDSHKLWVQLYNKIDALRPMPYFGTPTI